ncbi:hypothetical protein Tdes44962_MAKER05947 [Teratosphaeria destructans]|uniref:YTH domain-containing protein n=1 Tax=Teratosphaeria destructans TaxID=418781 RepID=A0A9W7VY31_9PEZI|nr:hypothetical protein Tdes44962_MAKER05947 [Teratosphaeria destructans]
MNPGAMDFLPTDGNLSPPTPHQADHPKDDSSDSPSSPISDHYSRNPKLANAPPLIFHQGSHSSMFKKIDMSGEYRITEAFEGAAAIIRSLNPDYYSMSLGTRVVNGKTEHYQNIHAAIKSSRWSTIENSSKRIMELWDAREQKDDKLVLLLSVNAAQQYCGLAEIVGPWDPELRVDGWMERTGGAGVVGSFPITLRYLKNVPFSLFSDIKQDRNGHCVLNMWDGMRFDSEAGREVVEAYVKLPHFTNILAWPSDDRGNRVAAGMPYKFQVAGAFGGPKHIQDSKDRKEREGTNIARPVRGGLAGRGRAEMNTPRVGMGRGTNAALTSANWRDRGNQLADKDSGTGTGESAHHSDNTAARHVPAPLQLRAEPAPLQLVRTGENLDTPRQSKYFTCVEDQNGDYIPVRSAVPDSVLCVMGTDGKLLPFDIAMAKPDNAINMPSRDLSKSYAQTLQHAASTNVLSPGGLRSASGGNASVAVRNTVSANAMVLHSSRSNNQDVTSPSNGSASAGLVGGNRASARVLQAQRSTPPAGFVFGDHNDSAAPSFSGEQGAASGVEMPRKKPLVIYTGGVETTPDDFDCDAKSQTVPEKMEKWAQNTPTAYGSTEALQRPAMPTPRTALRPSISIADSFKTATADEASAFSAKIPVSKRGTFFGLLLEKARFEKKLEAMSRDDKEEFFRVQVQANEIDKMLDHLVFEDDVYEEELLLSKTGSSPTRADTLNPEDSSSTVDKNGNRPFYQKKTVSEWSWDTDVKRNIDSLVNSPPSSEVVMQGRGDDASKRVVSNPYEVLDDESEGGGAPLE